MGHPGYGEYHNFIQCSRCTKEMRVATTMEYDFTESKQLKLKGIQAQKIYMVCDNCYKGEWRDSRDIGYVASR